MKRSKYTTTQINTVKKMLAQGIDKQTIAKKTKMKLYAVGYYAKVLRGAGKHSTATKTRSKTWTGVKGSAAQRSTTSTRGGVKSSGRRTPTASDFAAEWPAISRSLKAFATSVTKAFG